jgi:phage terminase large subunit
MSLEMKTVDVIFLPEFNELFNPYWRYIVFEGGRYSGKSYHVALSLISRSRQTKLRILCTRELQNSIADSVHKLLSDIISNLGLIDFVITDNSIVNRVTGSEFIFKGLKSNITEIKSMEGIDICWIEEGQGITYESLDILTPTIRKQGSQIIITFNRYTELDPVFVKYVQNPAARTYHGHVNYDILEKYGLLTDVIKLEIETDRADLDLFAHKWLGMPLAQPEDAILNRTRVLEAMSREVSEEGGKECGVDVARFGGDRTVIAGRKGLRSLGHKSYTKLRTPVICDKVEEFCEHKKLEWIIKVDDTGVGGGVTDELIKRGWKVVAVNNGAEAHDKDRYTNTISEAWFH